MARKNCPWFSLRSNSIESRFRSIRRGNFQVNIPVNLRKSKSKIKNNSEFASLIKLFYSLRSIQAQFSACDLRLFRLHSLKSCFSESRGANFGTSLVDTRSIHPDQNKNSLYLALICVFDLITHFNSGFYVLSENVAEIACESILTWVLFLTCRLEFPPYRFFPQTHNSQDLFWPSTIFTVS